MFTECLSEYAKYLDSIKMDMSAQRKIGFYCVKNYNLPLKESIRLATREFFKATEDEIFMLANGTDFACGTHWVTNLFSEEEINAKQNICYEVSMDYLPVKINCVQVSEKEWIGKVDYSTLLTLVEHDCLSNNINKMTQLIGKKDGNDYYYHYLRESIRLIIKSIGDDSFKAPIITANIFSELIKFEYYESENQFVIKELKDKLFVIDGLELILAIQEMSDALKNKIKDMSFPIRLTKYNDQEETDFIKQQIEYNKIELRKKVNGV